MAIDLEKGTYTVTVTSGVQTTTAYATVDEPAELVASVSTPTVISCATPASVLAITATGGITPYTYLWSTGATAASVTVTVAGTYTATITDAKGCIATVKIAVTGECIQRTSSTAFVSTTVRQQVAVLQHLQRLVQWVLNYNIQSMVVRGR
jgi:hypothetical protein